ncbi:hypothetical protein BDA99DRAFT_534498 [Phascolomyces articulosus]|uniref:Uncharacterized protein n=1 Tax=Phascolomyces articulosus TaxID=60185 RepID=A0AAD5KF64_9FUNG|nr:hypothetical protein BDA99DRAFT_534498 [Phascolomyces articulosus]
MNGHNRTIVVVHHTNDVIYILILYHNILILEYAAESQIDLFTTTLQILRKLIGPDLTLSYADQLQYLYKDLASVSDYDLQKILNAQLATSNDLIDLLKNIFYIRSIILSCTALLENFHIYKDQYHNPVFTDNFIYYLALKDLKSGTISIHYIGYTAANNAVGRFQSDLKLGKQTHFLNFFKILKEQKVNFDTVGVFTLPHLTVSGYANDIHCNSHYEIDSIVSYSDTILYNKYRYYTKGTA